MRVGDTAAFKAVSYRTHMTGADSTHIYKCVPLNSAAYKITCRRRFVTNRHNVYSDVPPPSFFSTDMVFLSTQYPYFVTHLLTVRSLTSR